MNQKRKTILGLVALAVIIGGSTILYRTLNERYAPENPSLNAAATTGGADTADAPEKTAAPDFSVTDSEGTAVKLSDFSGKPVIINFWASWCSPCKEEMPEFQSAWTEFGDDITFMMVNATDGARETEESARAFIEKQGYTFPIYYDTALEAVNTYGITGFPTTFFIDKDGYVMAVAEGMINEKTLRTGIDLLIAPAA